MSLSEAEAEARLAALRRQREVIDRAIADLVLYLELGRRLNAGGTMPAGETEASPGPEPEPVPVPVPVPLVREAPRVRRAQAPRPVAFAEDPTGARQYGRALIEAACEVIAEAGRPLHAREIHDCLIARGFVIPGRDPVASLNTRLWKRAGEGGPLRRRGEALYGLAQD